MLVEVQARRVWDWLGLFFVVAVGPYLGLHATDGIAEVLTLKAIIG
jgi:hypothetical protein